MEASENAYRIIRTWEGLRLNAYLCPSRIWTIGYGSVRYYVMEDGRVELVRPVKEGDVITQQQANEFLKIEIAKFVDDVNSFKFELNQNQFDALLSLVYNIGKAGFMSTQLCTMIMTDPNGNDIRERWKKTFVKNRQGEVLAGLKKRREQEAELYTRPI